MKGWTRSEPIYDLIPNLYVQKVFRDDVLQYHIIYPCEDYVLHIPSGDSFLYDDDDNLVLDDNGNTVINPYSSLGGATASANYDFATNFEGFEAVDKAIFKEV